MVSRLPRMKLTLSENQTLVELLITHAPVIIIFLLRQPAMMSHQEPTKHCCLKPYNINERKGIT